jgi:hypothetical protein
MSMRVPKKATHLTPAIVRGREELYSPRSKYFVGISSQSGTRMVIEWLTLWGFLGGSNVTTQRYIRQHTSPQSGLIGPARTGPYFLALADILHPSAVGARGCWTPTSENPKKQISSIELPEIGLLGSSF